MQGLVSRAKDFKPQHLRTSARYFPTLEFNTSAPRARQHLRTLLLHVEVLHLDIVKAFVIERILHLVLHIEK